MNNESITRIKINYDGREAERGLKGLKSAFATAFSVVAVKQIYDFTTALAKMGAEGQNVQKTFSNFVPDVKKATAELNKAAMGMVEDTKLQQGAIQALISGIKFDDYITALEYASKYAISTGRNTEEVLSGIVNSFITGRGIGLRHAGIVVKNGANMVRDSIDQMKTKMNELDVSTNDPLVKMQQLNAEILNMKESVGKELIPVVNSWTTGFIALSRETSKVVKDIAGFAKYMAIMQTAGGDKELGNFRLRIEMAKELEDKQSALLTLDALKKEATKKVTETEEKRNEVIKKQNTGLFRDSKDRYGDLKKATEQLNNAKLAELEIEGALYIVRNRKEKKGTFKAPGIPSEEETKQLIDAQKKAYNEWKQFQEDDAKARWEKDQETQEKSLNSFQDYIDNYDDGMKEWIEKNSVNYDELRKQNLNHTEMMLNNAINITHSLESLSDSYANRELHNLDRKKLGEKRYNKEKEKIDKEAEERMKKFARIQQILALGQTIVSISQAQADSLKLPPPLNWIEYGLIAAAGAIEIATIQAQHFQRGYLGEIDRTRRADRRPAMIGDNEAVIPAPQYAANEDLVKAIVNGTANNRAMRGGSTINNFYGLSAEQIIAIQRDNERRKYSGRLI